MTLFSACGLLWNPCDNQLQGLHFNANRLRLTPKELWRGKPKPQMIPDRSDSQLIPVKSCACINWARVIRLC
jgi:hypothetical protein